MERGALTADLVGDVGGTNIRLALVERGSSAVGERWSRPCDDFENLDQAIGAFLQTRRENPVRACIAVAGPVANGSATLTNRPWRVSEEGLRGLGFLAAHVVNDFVVLAFGAPALGSAQTWLVGPDRPSRPDQPLAVLGPGTGFGAGVLVPGSRGSAAVATEAGHIAFAPTTTLEEQVAACVAKRHGRTSIERILSGPGLANLHHALGEIDGRAIPPLV